MSENIEFIPVAGYCLVSRKVMTGEAPVRWMTRSEPKNPIDNGWLIQSIADTPEYLSDPNNMMVVDYNEVCNVEPALVGIWDFPIGVELMMHVDKDGIHIIDVPSNQVIPREKFYTPARFR